MLWPVDPRDVTVRLPVLASLEVSRNRLARGLIGKETYMFRLGRFAGVLAASVFAALLFSPATAGGENENKSPETGNDMVVVGRLAPGDQTAVYPTQTQNATHLPVG